MRFRFCGNLDAPDWLLAEIAILAGVEITSVTALSEGVVSHILGNEFDYALVDELVGSGGLERSDVKAILAALTFIMSSAARYGVDKSTLSTEIQQLGLDKAIANGVATVYESRVGEMESHFRSSTLSLASIEPVHWRVDTSLGSSMSSESGQVSVQMQVGGGDSGAQSFEMSQHQFQSLRHEVTVRPHIARCRSF